MDEQVREAAVAMAYRGLQFIGPLRGGDYAITMAVHYLALAAKRRILLTEDVVATLEAIALAHKRKRGTDKFHYAVRDLVIVNTILVVTKEFSLKPTRSERCQV
jgi:hypothetical protein